MFKVLINILSDNLKLARFTTSTYTYVGLKINLFQLPSHKSAIIFVHLTQVIRKQTAL